ncbi:MAG: hypothetical protein Q9187_004034 [Circinaria calcarea]
MRISNRTPSAAPIPIPAFAPAERPAKLEVKLGSGDAKLVAIAEEADVAPGRAEIAPTEAKLVKVADEVEVALAVDVTVAKEAESEPQVNAATPVVYPKTMSGPYVPAVHPPPGVQRIPTWQVELRY